MEQSILGYVVQGAKLTFSRTVMNYKSQPAGEGVQNAGGGNNKLGRDRIAILEPQPGSANSDSVLDCATAKLRSVPQGESESH